MSNDSKVTSLDAPSVPDTSDKTPAKRVLSKSSGAGETSGKTIKIKIYANGDEGGNHAVFVSHNGVAYQIPRDQVVEVPAELVEILNNAITTVTSPATSGGGVTTREVPRYNFQNLG